MSTKKTGGNKLQISLSCRCICVIRGYLIASYVRSWQVHQFGDGAKWCDEFHHWKKTKQYRTPAPEAINLTKSTQRLMSGRHSSNPSTRCSIYSLDKKDPAIFADPVRPVCRQRVPAERSRHDPDLKPYFMLRSGGMQQIQPPPQGQSRVKGDDRKSLADRKDEEYAAKDKAANSYASGATLTLSDSPLAQEILRQRYIIPL